MPKPTSDSNFFKNNSNLKAADVEIDFTAEQLDEIEKCSEDCFYFIKNYVQIISLDDGLVPFELRDYQTDFIEKILKNREVLALWSRQCGKTQTTAAVLLWYALFNDRYTIAVLAHKEDQAQEILYRIQEMFYGIPYWLQIGVKEWNKQRVEFENGSRIMSAATSSGSIRGKSVHILYLDEFAHVEPSQQEAFFMSVVPTLASGKSTKMIITTTPKGMEFFCGLWTASEQKKNNYVRSFAPYTKVPGRDQAWAEDMIKKTSDRQFAQEFSCDFLGSTNTLIEGWKLQILTKMVADPISHYNEDIKVYARPDKDRAYCMTVDMSEGLNQDYSAFSVIDVTRVPYSVVATFRSNKMHPLLVPNVIYNTAKIYNEAMVMIETQSTGAQTARILIQDLEYENVMSTSVTPKGTRIGAAVGGSKRTGVMMSKAVKRIGCSNLKSLIESDKLLLTDQTTITEFTTFVADKEKFAAEDGRNDDMVMTLVIFGWMVSQRYFTEETTTNVREELYEDNKKNLMEMIIPFGFVSNGQDDEDPFAWNF